MGSLKPGVKYIYEHVDGITYAREFDAPPSERFEIGRTFERFQRDSDEVQGKFWKDVIETAKTNKLLQDAVNRVKIVYELSKHNGTK